MNTVPVFEAKNRLPFFIHQAEVSGPVFISRRNKNAAVLISFEEYNTLVRKAKKPNFLEKLAEFKKQEYGKFSDEEIEAIFGNVRDTTMDTYQTNVFEGVFDD